jgi:hypothetical protein
MAVLLTITAPAVSAKSPTLLSLKILNRTFSGSNHGRHQQKISKMGKPENCS